MAVTTGVTVVVEATEGKAAGAVRCVGDICWRSKEIFLMFFSSVGLRKNLNTKRVRLDYFESIDGVVI